MKVVIRLLDGDGGLLGWGQVEAAFRGDGCVYSAQMRLEIPIERAGIVETMNMQWCDLNINLDRPVQKAHMEVGQLWSLRFVEPLFQLSSSRSSLPSVTEHKNVDIEVPTGHLGIVTH
jgi:hypothetical protein